MSRSILSLVTLALIAAGCDDHSSNQNMALSQTSAQNKPIVSVVPIIDNTRGNYDWNISDELSSCLYERLKQLNHIAIVDPHQVIAKIKRLNEKNNPFASDISWVKNAFQGEEFVAFLELVEHEERILQDRKKTSNPSECNAHLNMSMRVRIFDLRDKEPKVILQELVHDSHFIPRQFTQENFYQVPWGNASFSISPTGLAHAKFIKEIGNRIDDYILMASHR